MLHWFPAIWHGTLREHYLLLFGAAGGVAIMTGFVSAWIGAHLGARRAIRRLREATPAVQTASELARLGQAIDAIAIEVERIAEAERFTAKLLAERPPAPPIQAPRREVGQITPH